MRYATDYSKWKGPHFLWLTKYRKYIYCDLSVFKIYNMPFRAAGFFGCILLFLWSVTVLVRVFKSYFNMDSLTFSSTFPEHFNCTLYCFFVGGSNILELSKKKEEVLFLHWNWFLSQTSCRYVPVASNHNRTFFIHLTGPILWLIPADLILLFFA